jgi:hypothetical protein
MKTTKWPYLYLTLIEIIISYNCILTLISQPMFFYGFQELCCYLAHKTSQRTCYGYSPVTVFPFKICWWRGKLYCLWMAEFGHWKKYLIKANCPNYTRTRSDRKILLPPWFNTPNPLGLLFWYRLKGPILFQNYDPWIICDNCYWNPTDLMGKNNEKRAYKLLISSSIWNNLRKSRCFQF